MPTHDRNTQRPPLVPRLRDQGYDPRQVAERRAWAEDRTDATLDHVGRYSLGGDAWRSTIENPIGAVQTPLGVAGPLSIRGQHARGTFYVPLATNQGNLVRSLERGMVALTRAGGADVRIYQDERRTSPALTFDDVGAAHAFAARIATHAEDLRAVAESVLRQGDTLLAIECLPIGRRLILGLRFSTNGDPDTRATTAATTATCQWLRDHLGAPPYDLVSGLRPGFQTGGEMPARGRGATVTAGVHLSAAVTRSVLQSTPERLCGLWHDTMVGHLRAGGTGDCGHFADALAPLFVATGQSIADLTHAAVGVTDFTRADDSGLDASVTLTSLAATTVGAGTQLETARECLAMIGCADEAAGPKLTEIAAALVLAGELAMAAAMAQDASPNERPNRRETQR